jgi:hypothetical protein
MAWTPADDVPVGSYVMRLTVEGKGGRRVYGGRRPASPERASAPVVHVLGIEAAFTPPLVPPHRAHGDAGARRRAVLHADVPARRARARPEPAKRRAGRARDGRAGADRLDREALDAQTITVQSGDWPSGLYAARLEADDGRVGFAPFILRAVTPSELRVAVVLPTNTWQAYNLYDADGDGWGDTWYAGGRPPVVLTRPYRDRGVPPRFRRYDFPFLRFLEKTRREPDFLSDDDLDAIATGDDLRKLYDLVVFPGHTEYVTTHAYDVVERYYALGGRLILLSANNFFWKVEREGQSIRRIAQWRTLGRPEVRMLGIQYRANDDGQRQAPFVVTDREARPWLFEGRSSRTATSSARRWAGSGSRST